MTEWLPLVAFGVFAMTAVPAGLTLAWTVRNRQFGEMQQAAQELGLDYEAHDFLTPGGASGTVQGHRVRVEASNRQWLLTVKSGCDLTLRPAGLAHAVGRVVTGDPVFDGAIDVEPGKDERATGLSLSSLSPELRRRMAALARFGAVHEYGEWRIDGLSSRVFLVNLVREVVAVSERLRAEVAAADVRERALRDEVAGVRAVATERLVRSLERKPTRDAALLAALEQELSTPLHRVRVARLRGEEGLPTIRASLASGDGAVAVTAALALAEQVGGHEAETALLKVLYHADRRVVAALGAAGTVRAVPPLLELQSHPAVGEAALTAARAIQGRLAGERGGLAVAEVPPAQGAVSEAAAAGRLSASRQTEGPR